LDRLRRVRRLSDAVESRLNSVGDIELTDGWRRKLHTPSVRSERRLYTVTREHRTTKEND